ncbi:hypothetical protein ABZP36_034473 [Zizania latifolia]
MHRREVVTRREPSIRSSSEESEDNTIVIHFNAGHENSGGWAQMLSRFVVKVADGLLHYDVAEYIRVRAVCKPWRSITANPSHLEPRFFPRRWLLQPESWVDGTYRFVNVLTGASLRIPMPREADMYSRHGSTEGLLVLYHKLSDTVCLLNPLTQEFTDLPFAHTMYRDSCKNTSFMAGDIIAAGVVIDEEKSPEELPPIVVMCVTHRKQSAMFYGKPGDLVWDTIDVSCIEEQEVETPTFHGGLAVKGRFYVPTRTGNVLKVELRPKPRLAYVAWQSSYHGCIPFGTCSYLVPSISDDKDDGVLLARMHTTGNNGEGCMLFVLDVASKRLTLITVHGMIVFLPRTTLRSIAFPRLIEGIFTEDHVSEIFRRNLI